MTSVAESRTVLIVEDDENLSASLADVLTLKHHRVVTASNREQAHGVLSESHPDAILLDIRLGAEDGLDLLPHIRDREPMVPVIVMTAHSGADTAIEALQRGAFDYLRKPFGIPDFLATLDRAFDHVTLARDKVQAERELTQTNETLSVLNERLRGIVEAATRIASVGSVEELSAQLLDIFAEHIDAGGGTLFRREADVLRRERSLDPPHVPDELAHPPRSDSILGRALAAGGNALFTEANSSGWDGYLDRSCLVVTIHADDGAPEYVLTLHNPVSSPFSDLDLELASLLASFLSEVIRSLRARGALRRQEALYRYLFERSHAMNIVLSSDARIVSLNQNALERLGYELGQLQGLNPATLIVEEDRTLARRRLRDVLARREIPATELRARTADGNIRVLYFPPGNGVIVRETDADPRIMVTALDVTERKLEEQSLFQASKLMSLGTLASGIAHEVNNPNSYIRMNAQNLKELCRRLADRRGGGNSIDDDLTELIDVGTEMLEGIVEGSERIASLVGQLREFVREEPRQIVQRVGLNRVVTNAIELLGPLVRRIPRSFDTRLANGLPAVRGDQHQLEQIVMNLVSNACQAVEEQGGEVVVITGHRNEEVFVEVRDDGPGIPAADLEQITDPFFTTKRTRGGTGLGLSVSARLVERHEGRLVFDSREGAGTTATVWLPAEGDEE